MMILFLILGALALFCVVQLFPVETWGDLSAPKQKQQGREPFMVLMVLEERYARGEISGGEYPEMCGDLMRYCSERATTTPPIRSNCPGAG